MSDGSSNRILQHLRGLIRRGGGGEVADGRLLERFVAERDEAAFEVLVWRHGPMVLGVARRVLHNPHDAEDVLQATFLTLVRRAGTIGKRDSLGSWLYKVAYRTALRARARAAKTVAGGDQVAGVPAAPEADDAAWRELRPLLDGAIQRLPEKYRTAVVLCDLQGKSYREVAEQLGCPIGTISTRLTRARQMLRKRLCRQGVALSSGVLAAALTDRAGAALPAPLVSSTVRAAAGLATAAPGGLPPARVAELMEGANRAMLTSRIKIAGIVALLVGAAAVGAGVTARREPPPGREPPPPPPAPKAELDFAPADMDAGVAVRGRVLGPGGKPVEGARLYWPRVPKTPPTAETDIEIPQRDKTDAEGHFAFVLPLSDIKPEWRLALVVVADGYGVEWAELPAGGGPADLTLRLLKEQPIRGRVLSTEGKPLAGLRVGIGEMGAAPGDKLDDFLAAWKREWGIALSRLPRRLFLPLVNVLPPVKTDEDGRFVVRGVGAERLAVLRVRGAGVSDAGLYVVARDGFDPTEINKAVLGRTPPEERQLGQPPLLYGPDFTYVAAATRRVEGTVREAGTGKPVPGVRIMASAGYNNGVVAVSGKDGKYRLVGLPKMKEYVLHAEPPEDSPWLRAGARAADVGGLGPLTADFTMARGIVVNGRVLDKATGKGVKGGVRFVPLPGNKFADKPGYDSFKYERLTTPVGADGRFRLAVIPGPGVLVVQAEGGERANGGQPLNPYLPGEFDARDRELVKVTQNGQDRYFTAVDNTLEFLTLQGAAMQNAVKVLDLAPDAESIKLELSLERGRTQTVRIEGPDGKPLAGATVAGVTASWPFTQTIKDATCTVFGLDPEKPRRLVIFHRERNLGGTLTVRGDEKEPPAVRLALAGAAMGRLLDADGRPVADAAVELSSPDGVAGDLYRRLGEPRQAVRTDKDGRFRVAGIVPEVPFHLRITRGRTFFVGQPPIGVRQVKPGATLDLGDVRVKPSR